MNLSYRLCTCVKSLVKPREKSIAFLRKINVGSRKSVDLILNDQVDIIHVVLKSANVSRCIVMGNMYYCLTLEFSIGGMKFGCLQLKLNRKLSA